MNISFVLSRILNILLKSENEWEAIESEDFSKNLILLRFVFPLLALVSVSVFIGVITIDSQYTIQQAILFALVNFMLSVADIYISAWLVTFFSRNYESVTDNMQSFKLVVYSSVPAYIAGFIANLNYRLVFFSFFGLYSVYLFWTGLDFLLKTPRNRKLAFAAVTLTLLVVLRMLMASLAIYFIFPNEVFFQ